MHFGEPRLYLRKSTDVTATLNERTPKTIKMYEQSDGLIAKFEWKCTTLYEKVQSITRAGIQLLLWDSGIPPFFQFRPIITACIALLFLGIVRFVFIYCKRMESLPSVSPGWLLPANSKSLNRSRAWEDRRGFVHKSETSEEEKWKRHSIWRLLIVQHTVFFLLSVT